MKLPHHTILPFCIAATAMATAFAGLQDQPADPQNPNIPPRTRVRTEPLENKPDEPKRDLPQRPEGPDITYESLVWQMANRVDSARFPEFPYQTRSVSGNTTSTATIEHEDRVEHVLIDAAGPGVVARLLVEDASGVLRVYLDGSDLPVIEEPMRNILSGAATWHHPLARADAGAWVLYAPIPFAEQCVITHDGGATAFHVEYREYANDAPVHSLTPEELEKTEKIGRALARAMEVLRSPRGERKVGRQILQPGEGGELWSVEGDEDGGGILEFAVAIEAQDKDMQKALQTTIIKIEFDGAETVWCPVGDFFGAEPDDLHFRTWWNMASEDMWVRTRFFMPYRESARFSAENLGDAPVRVRAAVSVAQDFTWQDDLMYFHADWRHGWHRPSNPDARWELADIEGAGTFIGQSLRVANPTTAWWGDGQAFVTVDDNASADVAAARMDHYFGFGQRSAKPFCGVLAGRHEVSGPGHYGRNWLHRQRLLDGLMFQDRLHLEFGVEHAAPGTEMHYASTVFWYGRDDAASAQERYTSEELLAIPVLPDRRSTYFIDDMIEAETLEIDARTSGYRDAVPQADWEDEELSGNAFLLAEPNQPERVTTLKLQVPEPGFYRITAHMVKSADFGVVYYLVNDQDTGVVTDLYHTDDDFDIAPTGPIDLGVHESLNYAMYVSIAPISTNANSRYPHYSWGLDGLVLTPVDENGNPLDTETEPDAAVETVDETSGDG